LIRRDVAVARDKASATIIRVRESLLATVRTEAVTIAPTGLTATCLDVTETGKAIVAIRRRLGVVARRVGVTIEGTRAARCSRCQVRFTAVRVGPITIRPIRRAAARGDIANEIRTIEGGYIRSAARKHVQRSAARDRALTAICKGLIAIVVAKFASNDGAVTRAQAAIGCNCARI